MKNKLQYAFTALASAIVLSVSLTAEAATYACNGENGINTLELTSGKIKINEETLLRTIYKGQYLHRWTDSTGRELLVGISRHNDIVTISLGEPGGILTNVVCENQ